MVTDCQLYLPQDRVGLGDDAVVVALGQGPLSAAGMVLVLAVAPIKSVR